MSGWVAGGMVVGGALSAYGSSRASKAAKSAAGNIQRPFSIFDAPRAGAPSFLASAQTGVQGYYSSLVPDFVASYTERTGKAPGISELNRAVMQSLSPEQAAAVAQGQRDVRAAQAGIGAFNAAAQRAQAEFGSQVGTYTPTLNDITGYTEVQTGAEQAQSLYDTQMAQTMAEEAFARRGVLSAEEQRAAQQSAREASSAAGRVGGNAAISAEILNREAAMAARRGEAATLGQAAYGQGMGALQQQLATQQARYTQLASEQDRELARRQSLFAQGLSAGQQNLQERQLGFNQMLGVEQQRGALRDQAMRANMAAAGLAQDFYTTPGRELLGLPLNLAQQAAGGEGQYAQAKNQANLTADLTRSQMYSSIGSNLMGMGMNMGGGSYGSMIGSGLSSIGGQTGNTGMYNYGANLYNQNIGSSTPPKALIV